MHSVTFKFLMLLVAGASTHASMTPPNPPARATERAGKKGLFESLVLWITWLTKATFWLSVSLDSLAMIYTNFTQANASLAIEMSTISSVFTVGVAVVFLSALLRKHCFRALGHLFTFEVTIRPKHKLITTGPYAWVRHPSYVGIYGTLLGSTMVMVARGSFLREYGLGGLLSALRVCNGQFHSQHGMPTLVPSYAQCTIVALLNTPLYEKFALLFLGVWLFKIAFALSSVNKRLGIEDGELKKSFGEEWEQYAKVVRWRLIPGLV